VGHAKASGNAPSCEPVKAKRQSKDHRRIYGAEALGAGNQLTQPTAVPVGCSRPSRDTSVAQPGAAGTKYTAGKLGKIKTAEKENWPSERLNISGAASDFALAHSPDKYK
jgi:hypothetical protein